MIEIHTKDGEVLYMTSFFDEFVSEWETQWYGPDYVLKEELAN